jgi:arylsulfatase A
MYNWRKSGSVMHLQGGEVTLAELLKQAGYKTAHFGKWHLGALPPGPLLEQPMPVHQGFDYSFGTEDNARPSHLNPVNFVRNGESVGQVEGYSCQIVAAGVERWLSANTGGNPLFMYVAFHEPHGPIASPPDLVEKYKAFQKKGLGLPEGTTMAEYYANIENLDFAVGRILDALERHGMTENTLVFFASDNGPVRRSSAGHLRGKKGEVYDGGIKVPGIISWPAMLPEARTIDVPVWFQDFVPTVADITGISLPGDRALDGTSILPVLKGMESERALPMYWYFYRSSPEMAMRSGVYSLIGRCEDTVLRTHWISDVDMTFIKTMQPVYFELYDLEIDPGQREDLANERPAVVSELKALMLTKLEELQEEGPVWRGLEPYRSDVNRHNKAEEFRRNHNIYIERIQ